MKRITGALYIIVSIVLLVYGAVLIRERTTPVKAEQTSNAPIQFSDSIFSVHIPSAGIELPAYRAVITGTTWQTSKRGISYLSTSPLPGEKGNSVLYGHNWPNLLNKLHGVKPGDAIFITAKNKTTQFMVRFVAVVGPRESSVYAPSGDTRLTIYTCTGFLDRKRLVITAFPAI